MRFINLALLAIADGLFLHQWNRFIESLRTSDTIKRLCRYALGVLGTWPMFVLFLKEQQNGHKYNVRESVAYVLSFVFVGIGVFVGYVIDSLIEVGDD